MSKEITTDGVEFGRSYSKGDAAATTRRRHRKPDPRAVAAAHDADHPPQLLHPRPSPSPPTPAPSAEAAPDADHPSQEPREPAPLTRRRHRGRRRGGEPSPRPPAGEDAEQLLSRSVESGEGERLREGAGRNGGRALQFFF